MGNSDYESDRLDDLILQAQLGVIDDRDSATLRQAMGKSKELLRASANLGKLLRKLDYVVTPEPPGDLAERILDRVYGREIIPFEKAASALPAGTHREVGGRPLLTIRELVAIAACITLFVGVMVPSLQRMRGTAQRDQCFAGLGGVMSGLGAYMTDNGGQLPYAGMTPGAYWMRVNTPGMARSSNSRNPYLLVKLQYVPSGAFICPSRARDTAMQADDPASFDDFAEPINISYSYQNMAGPQPPTADRPPMAIIGDANPLFDSVKLPARRSGELNSGSHQGAGQNVGALDGQVHWLTGPRYGPNADNVYLSGHRLQYTGKETPVSATDSFLIP